MSAGFEARSQTRHAGQRCSHVARRRRARLKAPSGRTGIAPWRCLEQARKAGRLQQTLIEEGFGFDRDGQLVYPPDGED